MSKQIRPADLHDRTLLNDILQWDVSNWKTCLLHWEKAVDWNTIHDCLELGAREGGLSLWLGLKGKNVVCSDISGIQITASPLHRKYHLSTINYQDINATEIPYQDHFDLIVFKSILGGIGYGNNKEAQRRTFESAHRALKPGGKLLFAENLAASGAHRFLRKKFVKWGAEWRYPTLNEMKEFLTIFKDQELKTCGVTGTFGRKEQHRHILAMADRGLFKPITPASWHYIGYGIATK